MIGTQLQSGHKSSIGKERNQTLTELIYLIMVLLYSRTGICILLIFYYQRTKGGLSISLLLSTGSNPAGILGTGNLAKRDGLQRSEENGIQSIYTNFSI
jgi:hypothetical protein